MTLVISAISAEAVFQVSDRVLSVAGQAVDALANKTVVYVAEDAVVSISYTGRAFVRSVPTDEWIALVLLEEDTTHRRQPGVDQGPIIRDTLDSAISALLAAVRQLPPGIRHEFPLEIVAVGWQRRRGQRRRRPVLWILRSDDNGTTFTVQEAGARQPTDTPAFWPSPERNLSPERRRRLQQHPPPLSRGALVSTLRGVAEDHPGVVGPHVMTVTMERHKRYVEVEFLPADDSHVVRWADQRQSPCGFTPWVIARDVVLPPQILVGTDILVDLGITVEGHPLQLFAKTRGPRGGSAVGAYMGDQPRSTL